MPALFVHPCNTADAMMDLSKATTLTSENYLRIWLGMVGERVGLCLPLASDIS